MRIVYIDAQNVHKSIQELGWIISRELFYEYLQHKFATERVIIFIGYIQKYTRFYEKLSSLWYEIIFKQVLVRNDGTIKWDVDIDIAIHAMKHMYDGIVSEAYLVSWDADYNSLIDEWVHNRVFGKLLVPNLNKTLYILRKSAWWKLQPLTDIKHLIEKKQKD